MADHIQSFAELWRSPAASGFRATVSIPPTTDFEARMAYTAGLQAVFMSSGPAFDPRHAAEIDEFLRPWVIGSLDLPGRYTGAVATVLYDSWRYQRVPNMSTYERYKADLRRKALRRESRSVRPIRLDGLEVEPLEADLFESARAVMESSPIRPDLAMVLLSLGFTYDEAAFLSTRHLDNLTWIETGAALRRTPQETQAIRRACTRKILKVQKSEIPPAGRPGRLRIGNIDWPAGCFEQLENGRYIWAVPR